MKYLIITLSALALTACATDTETTGESTVTVVDSTAVPATTGESTVAPVSATRTYAETLLDGSAKPANNKETMACLDSMMGVSRDTRDYFFDVYLSISSASDGVLAETVSEKAIAYFEQFPEEALANYKELSKEEKAIFTDDLAFEFYSSGGNIANDVNESIDVIEKNCKACAADEKTLEELRLELIKKASKLKS
ncbi:MAG: hypothetical protein V4616_08280 [Bacteroidota bacterium]